MKRRALARFQGTLKVKRQRQEESGTAQSELQQQIFSGFRAFCSQFTFISLFPPCRAMRACDGHRQIWSDPIRACHFLVFMRLLKMPRLCPNSHQGWGFAVRAAFIHLHCRERLEDEVTARGEVKRKDCGRKETWRWNNTAVPSILPKSVLSNSFIEGLYWFLSASSSREARHQAALTDKDSRFIVHLARLVMAEKVEALQYSLPKLGGDGKIVCIDETFFTKKRNCRGGFRGRVTAGHRSMVLGMVELQFADATEQRRATGNVRLLHLPARSAAAIEQLIDQHVEPGSLIFTDSFSSYKWLARAGFTHRVVNDRRREFSRIETIFGRQVNVSTHPAEGPFGRFKTYCRQSEMKRAPRSNYGLLMAEFLRRHHFVHSNAPWRESPLWAFCEHVKEIFPPTIAVQERQLPNVDATRLADFKRVASRLFYPPRLSLHFLRLAPPTLLPNGTLQRLISTTMTVSKLSRRPRHKQMEAKVDVDARPRRFAPFFKAVLGSLLEVVPSSLKRRKNLPSRLRQ